MISRYILSFISLITLVNFQCDIFAARLFHTPARNTQAPQIQRCNICKQTKPAQECTVTKFSVYCRACLLANGIDVLPITQPVDVTAPATTIQHYNRTTIAVCAAVVTAGTYYIAKKIRAQLQKQTQHQAENTKVQQNEV